MIAGDAASARADVESALERAPKDPGLQTLLGRVLLSQGDRDAARDAFDAATREDPLHADAWAALSRLEAREGNLPEAVALATRAIEQSGGAAEHLHQRAGLLNRLGRPREAMDDLEEVVRHDPANAGACNDLAWMLAESGTDLDRALDLATTAVRIEPTRAGFLDTLGWVHLQRGEAKAAAAQLRSAVRLAPMQPEIRDHLNLALRAQGEAPSDGDSDPAAAPSHDGSGRHE